MLMQLVTLSDETFISFSQNTIKFTTTEDALKTELVIPSNALLLIDIDNEKRYFYKGLGCINKYLNDVRSAKFEFDAVGTLGLKLMLSKGPVDEGLEFYFLASIEDE